jgi:hypothetical protein
MRVQNDSGVELNAEFSVIVDFGQLAVVLESAGGRVAGSEQARNSDYVPALELLLARLQAHGAVLLSVLVASRNTAALPESQRSLLDEPMDLVTANDLAQLRLRLMAAAGRVAVPADASKPGNTSKRILLRVAVPGFLPTDTAQLAQVLATGERGEPADRPAYRVDDLLADVRGLVRYRSSIGEPSLHKPIALLWAADQLAHRRGRLSKWPRFRREVGELLAGAGVNRTPEYPFWHLKSAPQLWEVHGVTDVPTIDDTTATAGFTRPAADLLSDPAIRERATRLVIGKYLAGRIDMSWLGERLSLPETEQVPRALDVLEPLVGHEIRTVTDDLPNKVFGVSGDTVMVGTKKSPNGSPVSVSDVQRGLDLLAAQRSVELNTTELGHRSSFVGAVLATLPNAQTSKSPPTVSLTQLTTDAVASALEDLEDTDGVRETKYRREQKKLRNLLADGRTVALCALCGERYPVEFLVAAHIKRRSVCTEVERKKLRQVAMLACVFGCDALYEKGWITVDSTGRICAAPTGDATRVIAERIADLAGGHCAAHSPGSEPYFAWHRSAVFRKA